MGKNAQLAKLETRIETLEFALKRQNDILQFIKDLSEMEDCTIIYSRYGVESTSSPVAAAKCFMEKISVPSNDN